MSDAQKSAPPSVVRAVLQLLSRIPVQELLKFKLGFNLEMSSGWVLLIVVLALIIGATF